MQKILKIEAHSVHLWQAFVPDLLAQLPKLTLILNESEIARANRFHFELHRVRYIISRAVLRYILSFYTAIPAKDIIFKLGHRGKPYLAENAIDLQFNVSHSEDMVVYALTTQAEIGIDIEKMESHYHQGVAERFFSPKEYGEWMALPDEKKMSAFYRVWASKEAIIKALGEGLYAPLSDFSVNLFEDVQTISLGHLNKQQHFYLENFSVNPDYQSAFATPQPVNNIVYWDWNKDRLVYD